MLSKTLSTLKMYMYIYIYMRERFIVVCEVYEGENKLVDKIRIKLFSEKSTFVDIDLSVSVM